MLVMSSIATSGLALMLMNVLMEQLIVQRIQHATTMMVDTNAFVTMVTRNLQMATTDVRISMNVPLKMFKLTIASQSRSVQIQSVLSHVLALQVLMMSMVTEQSAIRSTNVPMEAITVMI